MFKNNQGIALLLTMIILGMIVASALSISTLILGEIKMNKLVDDSVQAIFAADAGMEKLFYWANKHPSGGSLVDINYTAVLANGAQYEACTVAQACTDNILRSRGIFNTTQRALEASY